LDVSKTKRLEREQAVLGQERGDLVTSTMYLTKEPGGAGGGIWNNGLLATILKPETQKFP